MLAKNWVWKRGAVAVWMLMLYAPLAPAQRSGTDRELSPALIRRFAWTTGPPVVTPRDLPGISCYSIKDPSVVRFAGEWHLFCTIRGSERSHAIVYLHFDDWTRANEAERQVLPQHAGYFCAPQVFFYTPQKKWYLICQASDEAWSPPYQAAYSTSEDIHDPAAWTPLAPLGLPRTEDDKAGLDFWIICDADNAHLFFSTLDGRIWRSETSRAEFPRGWSLPEVAIEGDVFEASHTYKLSGRGQYLTLIEAQNGHGWRYYKAYMADELKGPWRGLAATKDEAFASMKNVDQPREHWSDSISHGELLRINHDETPTIDPSALQFLFQGVSEEDRKGRPYGQIPWRLGLLEVQ